MNKIIKYTLETILGTLALITPLKAQHSINVTTRTLDRTTDKYLPGVRVDVDSSSIVGHTDSTGHLTLSDVPDGNHTLTITKDGYKGFVIPINVTGNVNAAYALPEQLHKQPAGDTTFTVEEMKAMVPIKSYRPNGYIWPQLEKRQPIDVFLSNNIETDIDTFKTRISAGTGNWQDSPAGSVENNLEHTIYKITNDATAANNHGVVVNFNAGVNSTAPLPDANNDIYIYD